MAVSADWQLEYAGLLMGDGTNYDVVEVVGLGDLPDVAASDRPRLRRHGLHPGDDFMGGRSVTLALEVWADTDAALSDALEALAEATNAGSPEAALEFQLPGVAGGGRRRVLARPRKRSAPLDLSHLHRLARVDVEFFATSPVIQDAVESSETTTLPSAGGGLNFPATFPITFGAVSTGGTIAAVNAGTFPTSPSFRIDGPCTNPRIENVTEGAILALDIELGAGEYLLIDADARTVLLNGTASRYSSLTTTSEWWDLQPGTSDVTFRASTTSAATLTVTWRSAWV